MPQQKRLSRGLFRTHNAVTKMYIASSRLLARWGWGMRSHLTAEHPPHRVLKESPESKSSCPLTQRWQGQQSGDFDKLGLSREDVSTCQGNWAQDASEPL